MVYPHSRIVLAMKRNGLMIYAMAWMNLKIITLNEKKPDKKAYVLYDSIYIHF